MAKDLYKLVSTDAVHSFVKRCMVSAGVDDSHAVDLANLLLAADRRGHFSHGINRLGKCLGPWAVSANAQYTFAVQTHS